MLQVVTFRIVPSEDFPSLPWPRSRLGSLRKTSCSSQKWAATQPSCPAQPQRALLQPPAATWAAPRRAQTKGEPMDPYWVVHPEAQGHPLHVLSSAPRSEVLGVPQRKGNEVEEEERTSPPEYPDPQIHTDNPTPFGYGGMIPLYLFHIEQRLQCRQIDLPFVISKTLQCSHNALLEKVEGNIELTEIVFLIIFGITK